MGLWVRWTECAAVDHFLVLCLSSVRVLLASFIRVFNRNQSWYMNFKSSLKYFSYSRSVGPGEISEGKQRQPGSEDAARARGGRATAALERGQLRTRVPVPVTRECCAVPARGARSCPCGPRGWRGAPRSWSGLAFAEGRLFTHKLSSNWSDGDNWVSCRCMQN